MTTAGLQLREWRKQNRETAFGLAQAIGIAPTTIPHLERGSFLPSFALAERIRAVTSIPIEDWGKLSGRGRQRKKHRGTDPRNFKRHLEPAPPQQPKDRLKPHRMCERCSSEPRACSDESCVVFAIRLEEV